MARFLRPIDERSDRGTIRRRRLIHAVAASGISKILALAVQLLALPFALHSLGTDRYTSFLALQSFLSWIGLCGFGISYSLPKYIAAANIREDVVAERNLVGSALLFMAMASAALVAVLGSLAFVVAPRALIAAANTIPPAELQTAYFVAVAVNALQLFSSVETSLRAGYQEVHRSSICGAISSMLTLCGLAYAATHRVSVATFIVVLFLPQALVFLTDVYLLFLQRPYLRRGPVEFFATVSKMAAPSGDALAYQIQFALTMYIPTLIVSHLAAPRDTAAFGSVLQLVVLGVSSFNLIFQPLTSAMANAHSHGDADWIVRNHRRTLALVVTIGVVAIAAAATIGPFAVGLWMRSPMAVTSSMLAAFGACFLFMALVQLEFFVLSAMGALRGAGFVSLVLGAGSAGCGAILCLHYGTTGMAWGLAAGLGSIAAWLFWCVRLEIGRMESGPAVA